MTSNSTPPPGNGRESLKVWLQLLALLLAVGCFGWAILHLTLSLR